MKKLIARVIQHDVVESDDDIETETLETPARTSLPRYELPVVPEGYVTDKETARDFLACNDRYDLKKLLAKLKEKSLNGRMKYDPTFATSPICVHDQDYYDFSVDPDINNFG